MAKPKSKARRSGKKASAGKSGKPKKKVGPAKKLVRKKTAPRKVSARKKTAARKASPKRKASGKKAKPRKASAREKASLKKRPAAKKTAGKRRLSAAKKAVPTRKAAAPKKARPSRKPVSATRPAPKTTILAKKVVAATKPQVIPLKKPEPPKEHTLLKEMPASAKPIAAPPAQKAQPSSGAVPSIARPRTKVLSRQFLMDLGLAIKEAVAPFARAARGREIVSTAPSGDATFELDVVAEKALLNHLRTMRAPVAYYSEDAGYSTFSNAQPKDLLIVDPIDGTRAAKSGFEGCVVAIASTRVIERPTIADLDNACVVEILGDRLFYAERGAGARIFSDGHTKRPKLSTNTNLETVAWSMTVPARPAELIFPTAARLIDLTSLKGGFFACNSTSYSLTRLLTNQLDACVDFAGRYLRDVPSAVRDYFINAGRGTVIGIAPYDFAAALLIAQEAGCTVTDAYGRGFDDVLLLDSSEVNHQSLIAASNQELHEKLLSFFDTRIKQFESLLARRMQTGK